MSKYCFVNLLECSFLRLFIFIGKRNSKINYIFDQRINPEFAPVPPPPPGEIRPVKTFSDFDSDEILYSQTPAHPIDVRRKFNGHDKKVAAIALIGRKMMFATYQNLSREISINLLIEIY